MKRMLILLTALCLLAAYGCSNTENGVPKEGGQTASPTELTKKVDDGKVPGPGLDPGGAEPETLFTGDDEDSVDVNGEEDDDTDSTDTEDDEEEPIEPGDSLVDTP